MCPFAFSTGAVVVLVIAYWKKIKSFFARKK